MKLKHIISAIVHQFKDPNWFTNIFVTQNSFGIFRKSACYNFKKQSPKVGYNTEQTARKVQNTLNNKGNNLKCYKCPHCGKYHLGHNTK